MTSQITTRQIRHKPTATGAVERQLSDWTADVFNVRDFGATGNGSTNDSTAVQACITAAQAAGKEVYFPAGTYVISSLGAQSGRLLLCGDGNATLLGTLTYTQSSFPTAADTATPLTTSAAYFQAKGLNFQAVSGYALQLTTPEQTQFLSTFDLSNCRFFGPKGLLARQMIGFQIHDCEFNNSVAGARFESCTNGQVVLCRFQNQAESGVWITRDASDVNRYGGENIKFVLCEWAVCTYGLVVDQHNWLALDSCLIDYCAVPLFLSGAKYTKASNSYFGASNTAVSRFSAVSGYLAPVTSGIALYGRPGGSPSGSRVVGFTSHNCEFINYVGSSNQPIVYIDGYISGTYPMSGGDVSFYDCLLLATAAHSATTLLQISAVQMARVIGCRFNSYNKSSSMANAYQLTNCMVPLGHSNDFQNCTQSSVAVASTNEKMLASVYVQAGDPGTIGAGNIWVQP